jgi:hypothetical protein
MIRFLQWPLEQAVIQNLLRANRREPDDRREWMANQMPQQTAVSGSLFLVKLGY